MNNNPELVSVLENGEHIQNPNTNTNRTTTIQMMNDDNNNNNNLNTTRDGLMKDDDHHHHSGTEYVAVHSHAESHTRSLIKGFTWRVLATSTTTLIAWIVTGKVDAALQIGLFEFAAKLFIYYLHERLWVRIKI